MEANEFDGNDFYGNEFDDVDFDDFHFDDVENLNSDNEIAPTFWDELENSIDSKPLQTIDSGWYHKPLESNELDSLEKDNEIAPTFWDIHSDELENSIDSKPLETIDLGWYHKPLESNELDSPEKDKKKVEKILMVINAHGVVCQKCIIDFEFDTSKPVVIERRDSDEITIKARQNENLIAEITTEICPTGDPVTLINFPCAVGSFTYRNDVGSSDNCSHTLYLNYLLSNSTSVNLDKTLTDITEKISREVQEKYTDYSDTENAGIGQVYMKKDISRVLSKSYSTVSTDSECSSIDLYIYDSVGTHKYTIMAPPVKIDSTNPEYRDDLDNESKYNPRVKNSFNELREYYSYRNTVIDKMINSLKKSMVFYTNFFPVPDPDDNQMINNVRFCLIANVELLKFMNSFKMFGCPKRYIIDGTCFGAKETNYDRSAISPEKEKKIGFISKEVTGHLLDYYGGALTKRVNRTKRSKRAKRSKRTKRTKCAKRSKRTKRKMK